MTNTGTSGIQHQDRKFLGKISQFFALFSTLRRYFNYFFLCADSKIISIECVIIFYRFSFTSTKYFAVYFSRKRKSDTRVANLI